MPAPLDEGRIKRFQASCRGAFSGPDGQLAFAFPDNSYVLLRFELWSPDGSSQQGEIHSVFHAGPFSDMDGWFHPTSAGWAAIVYDPAQDPPQVLQSFDRSASVLGTSSDFASVSAPDAHGGTVLFARPGSRTGTTGPRSLEWFDGSGNLLRTAQIDDTPSALIVNWSTDHVLAIFVGPYPERTRARWYDGSGVPLTDAFDVAPADRPMASMHLLLDGTIAMSDGATWWGLFRDGVARVDQPPGWLGARPSTRLATIRGGRGYAVVRAADPATFEIVAASGESCGKVTLPPPPDDPSIQRDHPDLPEVGWDGTVFQSWPTGNVAEGGAPCEYRWWPGLLK